MIDTHFVCSAIERELYTTHVVKAWLGYGEPLFLEFSRESPDRRDSEHDARVSKLATNFAEWSVSGEVSAHQEQDPSPRLEAACRSLVGAAVQGIAVSADGALTIQFDDQRVLQIVPWPDRDRVSDAWYVSLGGERILAVSNAGQLAIVERDRPIRDWFPKEAGQVEPDVEADEKKVPDTFF